MPDHNYGKLFDDFRSRPSSVHGGSYFDEGFSQRAASEAHGKLFDRFGVKPDSPVHGQHFDEFGWETLPALHGQQFDSDFATPTAHGTQHGTWFDVFRGGTEVHYLSEGKDAWGIVEHVTPTHANVRGGDGQIREVALEQFLHYRTPNEQQATPSIPDSDAHAPSAHDSAAHGGGRTDGSTEMPATIAPAPQGQHRDSGRVEGIPDGLMNTFQTLKSLADQMDVEKNIDHLKVGPEAVPGLKKGDECRFVHGGTTGIGKITRPNVKPGFHRVHVTKMYNPRTGFGQSGLHDVPHGAFTHAGTPGVAKTVDSTETATQGASTVGHRSNCPKGGSAPCGADVDGHCSICNASVRDHEAVGKTSTPLDITVPEREHKTSDHHGSGKRRCPHCDGLLDHETELGHPSRQQRQGGESDFNATAHKCLGTSLDLLKSLA